MMKGNVGESDDAPAECQSITVGVVHSLTATVRESTVEYLGYRCPAPSTRFIRVRRHKGTVARQRPAAIAYALNRHRPELS